MIRVALIGCGNIVMSGHLPALLDHERYGVVGLCDVKADRAQAAAEKIACHGRPRPRVVMDYQQLLTAGDLDACIVALHPEHSVSVVLDLLSRDIPVLDEKPLAIDIQDGLRVAEAAEASSAAYQIGFTFRYCVAVQQLTAWARDFGSPLLTQVHIYDERPSQHRADGQAMIQAALARSSPINHEGSHVFDWMNLLCPAPPIRVSAAAIRTDDRHHGTNLWMARVGFADDSQLELTVGWLLEHQPPCSIRMVGGRGSIDLDLFTGQGVLRRGDERQPIAITPYGQDWRTQLDLFAQAVGTGRTRGANAQDGLRALRLAQACEQAARLHAVITLHDSQG
jgi:predicted dehydrogenase